MSFASWILFEDEGLVAIDKPAGVLSQGGEGGAGNNVVDLARAHYGIGGIGVLHRIDRNVSGVVLVAKNHATASAMTKLFARGKVERIYRAIVRGNPKSDAFEMDDWLAKDRDTNEVRARKSADQTRDPKPEYRSALTKARVLRRLGKLAELEVVPITGRSHQIRVHLAEADLPIVGDPKYGWQSRAVRRPLLHALTVSFDHPRTRRRITIEAPIPWTDDLLRKIA